MRLADRVECAKDTIGWCTHTFYVWNANLQTTHRLNEKPNTLTPTWLDSQVAYTNSAFIVYIPTGTPFDHLRRTYSLPKISLIMLTEMAEWFRLWETRQFSRDSGLSMLMNTEQTMSRTHYTGFRLDHNYGSTIAGINNKRTITLHLHCSSFADKYTISQMSARWSLVWYYLPYV
jgi:hypothetical protein